ncbi:hypothetical protein F5141DRAFT_702654 [Pisolithus sp. B1]|nr:hypothetical protein F5141DRAFT_702654 [Pisolithus sp. B1]
MHQTPIGWAFWLGNVQASDCSGKPALSIRPLGEHVSLLVNRNPNTSSSYLLLSNAKSNHSISSHIATCYPRIMWLVVPILFQVVPCVERPLHSGDGLVFQGRECVTVTRVRKWLFACKILRNPAITYSTFGDKLVQACGVLPRLTKWYGC